MDGTFSGACDSEFRPETPETTSRMSSRTLTSQEEELLKRQGLRVIPSHKQEMLEVQARKHWDIFYKRNSTKFFKDRHWTTREFQELSSSDVVGAEDLIFTVVVRT